MKFTRSKIFFFCIFTVAIFYPFEYLILSFFGIGVDVVRWGGALLLITLLFSYVFRPTNKYYEGSKLLLNSLILWTFFVLVRTIPKLGGDAYTLKLFLSNNLLIAILPFVLCIDFQRYTKQIVKLFQIIALFVIPVIVLFPFVLEDKGGVTIEFFAYAFATPVGLLLMLSSYESKVWNILLYIAVLITFLIPCMTLGRRAATLYLSFFLVATIVLNYRSYNRRLKQINKRNRIILICMFLVGIFIFLDNIDSFAFLMERFSTGTESRDDVIEYFIDDFNRSSDWLMGRSFVGTVEAGSNALNDDGTRGGIESGWLTFILQGGIIYALIHLLLVLETILNAFKAKNLFCKALGFWVLYLVIDMIGFGVLLVNLKSLMFYVAMSVCHSKILLNSTDEDIYKLIHS